MRLIHRDEYGYYLAKNNKFIVGTTNRNEYYPVYASFELLRANGYNSHMDDKFSSHIVDDIFLYNKPSTFIESSDDYTDGGVITTLLAVFKGYNGACHYRVKNGDEHFYLNVYGGYIMDEDGNILIVLTAKSSTITSKNRYGRSKVMTTENIVDDNQELIPDNLRLYISTQLLKDDKYKIIFKKLDKELIQPYIASDVDVMFTTSEKIEESLFKNDFEVKFDSLTELDEHLKSEEVSNILFLNEQLYQENVIEEGNIETRTLDSLAENLGPGIMEQIRNTPPLRLGEVSNEDISDALNNIIQNISQSTDAPTRNRRWTDALAAFQMPTTSFQNSYVNVIDPVSINPIEQLPDSISRIVEEEITPDDEVPF